VFPITLGSYGPNTKWPRAQDKCTKKCPGTPGQGIFSDFPQGPGQNSHIYVTHMQGLFGILYTKCAALYKNKKVAEPCT